MTRRQPSTPRLRHAAAALLAALFAAPSPAQDPPASPPPAESATAPAAAPATADPAPTIPSDLERLAEALPGEHRVLKAGEEAFDVFVRNATGTPAKGALVLIPGDGGLPPTSTGLGVLREELPAHGWSTWLVSLVRPPRVQAVTSAPGEPAAGDSPAAKDEAAAPEATADTAKAAAAQEADFPDAEAPPGLDARITARMQDWITASTPRIAAAVAEAAKEGPVTLVAEGAAAALLTGFVGSGAQGVAALILIDPVEVQGAEARWPDALGTPVLEVLDAQSREAEGRDRRNRATAAKLAHYRQLTLPGGYETEEGQPSMLARRIRGWLLTLPEGTMPPTPGTPPTPAKTGPEALGPNRS